MNRSDSSANLKDQAYEIIKERLIDCVYPPGSFINESQLASELGFSRTPVREAIGCLEGDNLVQVIPKKGIYVTKPTLSDAVQIFQARMEIEPVALLMAADKLPSDELLLFREKFLGDVHDITNAFRLDAAMHLFIIEHCGNRYIIDMMRKVFEHNTRVIISSKQNRVQIHDAKQEHVGILDALLAHEPDEASRLMRIHIGKCRDAAFDYLCSVQTQECIIDAGYRRYWETWQVLEESG